MSPAKRRERSAEERAAAAEASRVRVEEAVGRIDEGVRALRDGDGWRRFLSQSAKFHRYSFGNLLLIGAQNPQATRVASYRKWLSLDRQVRRGEHGLKVLAPVKVMVPVVDEHDVQRRDADGKPIRRPQVRGWTTETVFDVSQTDGKPLARPPEPIELDGPAPEGMWEALVESTAAAGYQLELAELPTGVQGRTVYASRTVTIDPDQHGGTAGQAATLAHELAHIMLHEPGTAAVDADLTTAHCRGEREVEAESTAIVVADMWGLDTGQMSLPYIAGWLSAVPDADVAVRRVGDRVVRAAHAIEVASRDNDHGPLMERIAAARTAAAALRQQVEQRATPDAGTGRDSAAQNGDHGRVEVVERDPRLAALAAAASFYRSQVDRSWVPDYANRRNLFGQLAPAQAGYAPAGWTTLLDHLRRAGHDDRHIVAAGLARSSSNQNLIDVFRDRLVLPVTNNDDQSVVGFVGRVGPHAQSDTAKYVNSPGSDLYTKGRLLYGLGQERDALQQGALPILVEGPLDVLAIRAARQDHPIVPLAVCGTAFTSDHAQVLVETISSGREIAVAFDQDPAGRTGMARTHALLGQAGLRHSQAVGLPVGQDPAELVRAGRSALLRQLIDQRQPLVLAAADSRLEEHPLPADITMRVPAARYALGAGIPRTPYTGQLVAHVADRTGLDPDTVTSIAADLVSAAGRADQRRAAPAAQQHAVVRRPAWLAGAEARLEPIER